MKVLVTGSAGFIGSALMAKHPEYIGFDLQMGQDVLNKELLSEYMAKEKPDVVVHLAGLTGVRKSLDNPSDYFKVNVLGTLNVLEAMRKNNIKQLVFSSTSSVYGDSDMPFMEDDNANSQLSPYACSKKSAELLIRTYHNLYGIRSMVLRFFTVYGPNGRKDMAPYLFTDAISHNRPITKYGDGLSVRDYTYIDDIVEGIERAIENPVRFSIVNLGSNRPIRLNQLIKTIEQITKKKAIINEEPERPEDMEGTWACNNKALNLYGWKPKVDFEEGMKRFINWYRSEIP